MTGETRAAPDTRVLSAGAAHRPVDAVRISRVAAVK